MFPTFVLPPFVTLVLIECSMCWFLIAVNLNHRFSVNIVETSENMSTTYFAIFCLALVPFVFGLPSPNGTCIQCASRLITQLQSVTVFMGVVAFMLISYRPVQRCILLASTIQTTFQYCLINWKSHNGRNYRCRPASSSRACRILPGPERF